MHIGIITYQTGHLKTWQMLRKLQTKSFQTSLYAFPFAYRPPKPKAFEDRPYQIIDLDIKNYCKRHDIRYIEVDGWNDIHAMSLGMPGDFDTPDLYINCIAKIIPQSFIVQRTILNSHPGLLPENRGVDAFKWSIINIWPVGISLHIIDARIDAGVILHRMKIPVLMNDNIRDVADRAYEMESDLLANFDYYLHKSTVCQVNWDQYPLSKKRIPDELDQKLEKIFLEHREKLVELSF